MLALKELLHNLKDRDWDANPVYKMDENEARRIIEGIEALEQQSALDKIRAELIQSIQNGTIKIEIGNEELFHIIDKYKIESEE